MMILLRSRSVLLFALAPFLTVAGGRLALSQTSPELDSDPVAVADSGQGPNASGLGSKLAKPAPYEVIRDGGELRFEVPVGERLDFDVEIEAGVLGNPDIGRMTIEGGTRPHRTNLLAGTSASDQGVGWLRATAKGDHLLYSLLEVIETSYLPQSWPEIYYKTTQSGSENRRRQNLIGKRDGKLLAEYRRDGHCRGCKRREHYVEPTFPWQDEHHCDKCDRSEHRDWRPPEAVSVGPRTVDMLSAVLIARSLVASGEASVDFQVIDKKKIWNLRCSRGSSKKIETKAGTFRAVELKLRTSAPKGAEKRDEKFSALFGLHGSIRIWVEANTGVPLLIQGDVPAGPINIGVRASLVKYKGTPAAFRKVPKD